MLQIVYDICHDCMLNICSFNWTKCDRDQHGNSSTENLKPQRSDLIPFMWFEQVFRINVHYQYHYSPAKHVASKVFPPKTINKHYWDCHSIVSVHWIRCRVSIQIITWWAVMCLVKWWRSRKFSPQTWHFRRSPWRRFSKLKKNLRQTMVKRRYPENIKVVCCSLPFSF